MSKSRLYAANKRKKDAVSVLNKVDYDSDNLPIGMVEDNANSLSANFGTDRLPKGGGCYAGDGSAYVLAQISDTANYFNVSGWFYIETGIAENLSRLVAYGTQNLAAVDGFQIICRRDEDDYQFLVRGDSATDSIVINNIIYDEWFYLEAGITGTQSYFRINETVHEKPLLGYTITTSTDFYLLANFNGSRRPNGGVYDFKYNVDGINVIHYKCDEESGDKAIDSSGNKYHGEVMNLHSGFHGQQNIKSYSNDVGYTLSDGANFYFDSGLTELIPAGVIIPRDESNQPKCVAYTTGGVQADLQYIGKVPSRALFKGSSCFEGDDSGYATALNYPIIGVENLEISLKYYFEGGNNVSKRLCGSGSATNTFVAVYYDNATQTFKFGDVLEYVESAVHDRGESKIFDIRVKYTKTTQLQEMWIDGVYTSHTVSDVSRLVADENFTIGGIHIFGIMNPLAANDQIWDIKVIYDTFEFELPLCEPIKDAGNHTCFDISGNGNHATLINGSLLNDGKQDEYHWLQNGYSISDGANYYYDQALTQLIPSGHYIPALESDITKCVAYTSGGVLANCQVQQGGESFLESGCTLEAMSYPELVQSEQGNRFWTDINDDVVEKVNADFTGVETGDRVFNDISESNKVKNIRTHKASLTGRQLLTEKKITNN